MALGAVFIAAIAQVFLKKAAMRGEKRFLKKFFNIKVIIAYFFMFLSTFINLIAYRNIDLRYAPAIGATGFILIPVFSHIFFGERPTLRKVIGTALIIAGVLISVLF